MNKFKLSIFLFILLLACQAVVLAKEEFIIGLSEHELGDQTISLNAGLFIPLPFLEFDGTSDDSNLSLGGVGALQWNAYLNSVFRIGAELGGSITFGPDLTTFVMIPITMKASYVLNFDRFEFPFFIGLGANILKYGNPGLFDVALIAKPGFAAYYRYNSNLSFGLNFQWWWNVEFPAPDYGNAIMGNFIEISPCLFYHF